MEQVNEAVNNDELTRTLLQNQRLIVEQNAQILQQQENLLAAKRNTNDVEGREKVPALVKVSNVYRVAPQQIYFLP